MKEMTKKKEKEKGCQYSGSCNWKG